MHREEASVHAGKRSVSFPSPADSERVSRTLAPALFPLSLSLPFFPSASQSDRREERLLQEDNGTGKLDRLCMYTCTQAAMNPYSSHTSTSAAQQPAVYTQSRHTRSYRYACLSLSLMLAPRSGGRRQISRPQACFGKKHSFHADRQTEKERERTCQ